MDKIRIYLGILILVCLALGIFAMAESEPWNPLETLTELELQMIGVPGDGSLVERLDKLEEIIVGRVHEGALGERLTRLNNTLYVNQPYDLCLLYKIQALEWVLTREESGEPIKIRLENLEQKVFGLVFSGPINKRLEKLISQIFPEGVIKGKWISIPSGLLIKVRIMDELSSGKNRTGDRFRFMVKETVMDGNRVLFPKGVIGKGVLQEVTHPANLGRDAQLMLNFAEIRAIDATPVQLIYGSKAMKMDRSRQWAVGASTAGMVAFGPWGILLGLAVKGKETTIPVGTQFYLQVKEPTRIYSLAE
ncbi:MAG TPA: hypothetical protein VHY08_02550 [Bacillota bacterium]|nr:hypothetical protein [Bacillota bacterium]